MIKELQDHRYDYADGTPTIEIPAWECDTEDEAKYKLALLGTSPLWEWCLVTYFDKYLVYGKPKRQEV